MMEDLGQDPDLEKKVAKLAPCLGCGEQVSTSAIQCGHCFRVHPTVELKRCKRCKAPVIKDADICGHCDKHPDFPDLQMPQHKTGWLSATVVGALWNFAPVWTLGIKAAAVAFFVATLLSFWRGNRVNKCAPIIKTRRFKAVGHLAMFAIYVGMACIMFVIYQQRF